MIGVPSASMANCPRWMRRPCLGTSNPKIPFQTSPSITRLLVTSPVRRSKKSALRATGTSRCAARRAAIAEVVSRPRRESKAWRTVSVHGP